MGLLKELLGVETLRDLGTVDTTTIGKTQYVTSLSLCRCNGEFQLEVSVLCRGRHRTIETDRWQQQNIRVLG